MLNELENNAPDTQELQHEENAKDVQVSNNRESDKEQNFRQLRERAEAAERRMQELERMVQANMSQGQQSQKIQLVEEDDDFDLSDDSYIEGKQFKKYVKGLKAELKNTKKQFEEFHQQSNLSNAEVRLKSQFTDFDNIVNADNLNKLATQKPSLYRSIMASQDIYDRGYAAYEMIKHSGIVDTRYQHQDKKLEENKAKPRSASGSSGQTADTPLARVGDYDRRILTEAQKEQLRRQVQQAKMYR